MAPGERQSTARYLVPGLFGAAISFAIRYIFADLPVALIGLVVFGIVYAVILLFARVLNWHDAPVLYAAVSAVATTMAFLLTRPAA